MKKFREISEQYREEGRHKLIQPKNKPVVSPRPENDSAKVKLGEAVKDKYDIDEYDQEGDMAKSDLRSIIANSKRVHDMLKMTTIYQSGFSQRLLRLKITCLPLPIIWKQR